MKSTLFLLLFFGSSHCNVENKISKVICLLCPYKDVDLLKGSLANPVKLSKDLFKECNIRFRIVTSDVSDFGKKNLMSFASLENQNKETLWPFQTIFFSKCHLPKGPFKYYFIKEVGGWGQKMAIFDDLQYCKSSKRWVGGPKKVKNMMT